VDIDTDTLTAELLAVVGQTDHAAGPGVAVAAGAIARDA
jgi:hypothetical protein